MAELLVHRECPVALLAGVGTRTDARAREVGRVLAAHGLANLYVGVRPAWYYGYKSGR